MAVIEKGLASGTLARGHEGQLRRVLRRLLHATNARLGLAIAKEIVDRHHGELSVESEGIPGKGATLTVWLQAKRRPDTADRGVGKSGLFGHRTN